MSLTNYGVPQFVATLTAYTVTTYTNTNGIGNVSFNFYLSSPTNGTIATTYLSGVSGTTQHILSGYLLPSTPTLSALSAVQSGIVLRWPSIIGNQDVYGQVNSSSFIPATSTFQTTINFNDPNFLNTYFTLSGNKSNIIITTSVIDNPFYDTNFNTTTVYGGLSTVNLQFLTVSNDCRSWNGGEV